MNHSLEVIFNILKKEFGTAAALSTISDIVYNVMDELDYTGKGVTEVHLEEAFKKEEEVFLEASKKSDVA